jgi:hypothetical protein
MPDKLFERNDIELFLQPDDEPFEEFRPQVPEILQRQKGAVINRMKQKNRIIAHRNNVGGT